MELLDIGKQKMSRLIRPNGQLVLIGRNLFLLWTQFVHGADGISLIISLWTPCTTPLLPILKLDDSSAVTIITIHTMTKSFEDILIVIRSVFTAMSLLVLMYQLVFLSFKYKCYCYSDINCGYLRLNEVTTGVTN